MWMMHLHVNQKFDYDYMIFLFPSTVSRRVVVSYKRRYVHKVLVNRFVKLAQEKKVWSGELTVPT